MILSPGMPWEIFNFKLITAFISTLLFSIVFASCLRAARPVYLLLALLLLPLLAIILFGSAWQLVGYHEFFHASIVHNIVNGFVPPEDVLLAGYPLQYPWAHHYLVGLLSRLLHLSPTRVFALVNLVALAVSAVVIYKLSQLLKPTRLTGVFGAFLAIFGTSIFFLPSLQFELFKLDHRLIPFQKFVSANSNPLGFCFFAFFLFFSIRLFACRGKAYANALGFFFSIAALAYFYPISWLAAIVSGLMICFGQAIFAKGRNWRLICLAILALFFGSMLAFPYLHGIASSKVETAEIRLVVSVSNVLKRLSDVLLISLIPLLVVWLKRSSLRTLIADRASEVITLCCAGFALLILYCFTSVPLKCEYKFLMQLVAVIAILAAPFFEGLYLRKPLLVEVLIPLILLQTAFAVSDAFAPIPLDDPVYEKAGVIRHQDRTMDRLYSWIFSETPSDTVVVDSFLTVPALGHRSLYVATDLRAARESRVSGWNGWGMSAKQMSEQVLGHQPEIQKRRLEKANVLLSPHPLPVIEATAMEIKKELKSRTVLVIARDSAMKKLFDSSPRFKKSFDGESVWVYTLES